MTNPYLHSQVDAIAARRIMQQRTITAISSSWLSNKRRRTRRTRPTII